MSVKDLSDPASVEAAMAEFDELGRDGFLSKYGFGRAYRYLLVRDGRRYDAKAIIGAAHGYEFPSQGPLTSSDFASSEHSVKDTLEQLGFEVTTIERAEEEPRAWVVRAGSRNSHADAFEELGKVAIGFLGAGDLTGLTAEGISSRAAEAFSGESAGTIGIHTTSLQLFVLRIRVGDIVLTPTADQSEVLVGRVTGDYAYADEPVVSNFRHNRPIEWITRAARSVLPEETRKGLNGRRTVYAAGGALELHAMFARPSGAAWIFQGSPKVFDVHGAVTNLTEQEWTVRQHRSDIHVGDRVYLWIAGDEAGVIGVGEIADAVSERASTDDSYVIDRATLGVVEPRVTVTKVKALTETLTREALLEVPQLQELTILRARQGTNFKVTTEQDEALWRLVNPLLPAGKDPLALPKWKNAWWVNQRTFAQESTGGYVWAPNTTKSGGTALKHWRALEGMESGDLILHYNNQAIRAVSRVTSGAEVTDRPSGLPLAEWEDKGWKVATTYFLLDEPIRLNEIPEDWRLAEGGPFDVNGGVKQQYANHLSETFVKHIIQHFGIRIRNGIAGPNNGKGGAMGPKVDSGLVGLIRRRKNVVLYGPPGTGKTREAFAVARWWEQQHGEGTVMKTTFHPSYGYEDFVQGFRPRKDDPAKFVLQDGILLRACEAAKSRDVLLIIDEINRGDVARVFGELITFIEADKRGDGNLFTLAQDPGKQYFIPDGLHFLGTMNTADKSVSLLDVALRRRFAFIEFPPDPNVFGTNDTLRDVAGINLSLVLRSLNARLLSEGIEPDRSIGHALLLIEQSAESPVQELRERIEYDIAPLVLEYSYLERDRVQRVLGGLVDAQGRFRTELPKHEFLSLLGQLTSGTTTAQLVEPAVAPLMEAEAFATDQDEENR